MRRFVLLLAALCSTDLPAQAPTQTARITGVVYDSIARRPMAGASVWSDRDGRTTTSDSSGRFVLDSLTPGTHVLFAAHESLDSLHLVLNARAEARADSQPSFATLATPSIGTIRRGLCPRDSAPPNKGAEQRGLITGTITNAANGRRLGGAVVQATWLKFGFSPLGKVTPDLVTTEVLSDSAGTYVLCDAPPDSVVQVMALAGDLGESGAIDIDLGLYPVVRLDLAVNGTTAIPDSSSASALPMVRRTAMVRGEVVDTAGRPLRDIHVLLEGTSIQARTSEQGAFVLQGAPLGTRSVLARRPGLAPARQVVQLTARDTLQLRLVLGGPVSLRPIVIRAPRTTRLLADFERRKRLGTGRFLVAEQLKRYPTLSSALHTVSFAPRHSSIMGRPCATTYIIDGYSADADEVRFLQPKDLVGIESYRIPDEAPMHLVPPQACGPVVIFWTKGM